MTGAKLLPEVTLLGGNLQSKNHREIYIYFKGNIGI
jgi:hypothetical protein